MTNPRWTPEKLDLLRDLVADPRKLSAQRIADLLHVKRMAVIGACFRNKIKLQGKPSGENRAKWGEARGKHRVRKSRSLKSLFPEVPNSFCKKEREPKVRLSDVVSLNLTFVERQPGQCSFPHGDGPFLFCGHPVKDESSYCPAHHKFCHIGVLKISDDERERRHYQSIRNFKKNPFNTPFMNRKRSVA